MSLLLPADGSFCEGIQHLNASAFDIGNIPCHKRQAVMKSGRGKQSVYR
jgi:hypothetical protein